MLLFYLRVGFPFLFYLKNLLIHFFPARMLLIEIITGDNILFWNHITSKLLLGQDEAVGLKTFAYKAFVKTHAYIWIEIAERVFFSFSCFFWGGGWGWRGGGYCSFCFLSMRNHIVILIFFSESLLYKNLLDYINSVRSFKQLRFLY